VAHKFAQGKDAISICDRCGFRYPLRKLKQLTVKQKLINVRVCPQCWEPDQPQLQQGKYPVFDPFALRNPRPDISYYQSGLNVFDFPGGGSRQIAWGWNPVGGASQFDTVLTPNALISVGSVASVVAG
jgi:hypothetical protein